MYVLLVSTRYFYLYLYYYSSYASNKRYLVLCKNKTIACRKIIIKPTLVFFSTLSTF